MVDVARSWSALNFTQCFIISQAPGNRSYGAPRATDRTHFSSATYTMVSSSALPLNLYLPMRCAATGWCHTVMLLASAMATEVRPPSGCSESRSSSGSWIRTCGSVSTDRSLQLCTQLSLLTAEPVMLQAFRVHFVAEGGGGGRRRQKQQLQRQDTPIAAQHFTPHTLTHSQHV